MPEERPRQGRRPSRSASLKRSGALQRTTPLERAGGLQRSTPLNRSAGMQRSSALARKTAPKRHAISPASPAQREKIKDKQCVVCGAAVTTPMHLWPRGKGGCDDPLCVLPACWACHRAYDTNKLDLLPHIVKHHLAEIAHAHLHAPPVAVLERLTASKVILRSRLPRPAAASSDPGEPAAAG
jgi:hypothetical protein